MAITIVDGFDLYNGIVVNTGLQSKWIAQSVTTGLSMVAGRFGGQAMQVVANTNVTTMMGRSITATGSLAVGFAFKANPLPTNAHNIVHFRTTNNTIYQDCLRLNTDGSLTAGRSTDSFGTISALTTSAAGVVPANTWVYIEIELVISDTVGSFNVWVDGTQVITNSNVDTRSNLSTNPADVDTVFIGGSFSNPGGGSTLQFDDFYVKDAAAHLGPRRVTTLYPSADVAQGFARSTGTANFSLVNEATVDGDTSYVQGTNVGDVDTYDFGDLATTPATIDAVQLSIFAEKTDATARSIAAQAKSGATTSDGANFTLAASYGKSERIMETDPNTSAAWAAAAVNALRGGPKVTV